MATWCCTLCCRCLVLAKLFFIQHVLDETHARSIIPKSAGSTFAFEVNVINVFFVVQCQSDVVMVPRPHLKELPSVAKHDQRPLNMIRNLHNQNFVVGIKKDLPTFLCGLSQHWNWQLVWLTALTSIAESHPSNYWPGWRANSRQNWKQLCFVGFLSTFVWVDGHSIGKLVQKRQNIKL